MPGMSNHLLEMGSCDIVIEQAYGTFLRLDVDSLGNLEDMLGATSIEILCASHMRVRHIYVRIPQHLHLRSIFVLTQCLRHKLQSPCQL